jgi:N utilization substance protein A
MITALLIEINSDKPGPSLYVSRAHTDFVARLFEREVSEIADKSVEVKAISREAGYRSKIAVFSPDPRVDPVGACVGIRGNRVKTIVRELGGEKVDIIQWDPDIRVFVTNALKPAKISKIDVDEEHKTVRIEVPEDQLSLSIGQKGQNARLETKLTGWRIDIVKSEQSEVNEDEQFANQVRRATEAIAAVPEIGEKLAALLVQNGFVSLDGIVAAESSYLADILDIDVSRAEEILAAVQRQLSK